MGGEFEMSERIPWMYSGRACRLSRLPQERATKQHVSCWLWLAANRDHEGRPTRPRPPSEPLY